VVLMAAQDMQRRLLIAGDLVEVKSRRGSQILPAQASDELRSGQAFIPMHWGDEYLSGRDTHGINGLTSPALDPDSKQPELKHAAVAIKKAELPWRFVAFGWLPADQALKLQTSLRARMSSFAYACVTLFGRDRVGVLFRAANEVATDVSAIEYQFGLNGAEVLRYADARRGISRCMRIVDGKLETVTLAGDVAAGRWLRAFLEEGQPVEQLGRLLLQPTATPPENFVERGKIVCSCFGVSERQINALLAEAGNDACVELLQQRLKCGANCGSCMPELKAIIGQSKKIIPTQLTATDSR